MLHFVRARIKGLCKRCKDGGDVEICISSGVSYFECVYCRLTANIDESTAKETIVRELSKVRSTSEKWAAIHLKPVRKKKKKAKVTLSPARPIRKKKSRYVV